MSNRGENSSSRIYIEDFNHQLQKKKINQKKKERYPKNADNLNREAQEQFAKSGGDNAKNQPNISNNKLPKILLRGKELMNQQQNSTQKQLSQFQSKHKRRKNRGILGESASSRRVNLGQLEDSQRLKYKSKSSNNTHPNKLDFQAIDIDLTYPNAQIYIRRRIHCQMKAVINTKLSKGAKNSLYLSDNDIQLLFDRDSEFRRNFRNAVNFYKLGAWDSAKDYAERCLKLKKKDGPSLFLLKIMKMFDYKKPKQWRGYRHLYKNIVKQSNQKKTKLKLIVNNSLDENSSKSETGQLSQSKFLSKF